MALIISNRLCVLKNLKHRAFLYFIYLIKLSADTFSHKILQQNNIFYILVQKKLVYLLDTLQFYCYNNGW